MGQCTGGRMGSHREADECYWKQPKDTKQFAGRKLPKLSFHGSLANFQLKKCPQPVISIRVEMAGIETFFLKQKSVKSDMSVQWQFEQKFLFEMTEYELRKFFIYIYFENEEESIIGQIKVNLYLISNGPYHQDYAVKLGKEAASRVSFDLKISQIIEVRLESLEAEVDLVTKHPGQKFNFSIKTIIGNSTSINASSASYQVSVMLDDHDQASDVSSEHSFTVKRAPSIQLRIPAGHNLVWSRKEGPLMPSIVMKTLVSELHQAYILIKLWKINDKHMTAEEEQLSQEFGESFIALHKIFAIDPILVEEVGNKLETRVFEVKQKIWHNGKTIGKGHFKFNVKNEQYIKQMQVMVRSEEGVMVYSPVFFDRSSKNSSRCEDLVKVEKIVNQVEKLFVRLDEIQSVSSIPNIEVRKIKVQIESHLESLIPMLEKSFKKSIICFSYSSENQLIQGQQIFISLGFKMISYLEEEDVLISEMCWQVLIALLRRGEFLLAHIGFNKNQKEMIQRGEIDSLLDTKIEVGLMYQKFLNKQLELAFKSLNIKGMELERNFAEIFISHAYFRIPRFRSKLLQAITRDNDPEIPEWRGLEFSLQSDINYDELQKQVNFFSVLCDWSDSFNKCLQKQEKSTMNRIELEAILEQNDWKARLAKRGIAFFYFINYWVEYIQSIVIKTKDIQWKYFPGYNKLIKSFLIELKTRSILSYPDALKLACHQLLSNEKILNPIISIVLSKANIYEPLSVIKAIEFISNLFEQLSNKGRDIPATLNYFQLYKAIKIILESDFSFAISRVLLMLYRRYKMFHLEFKRNISMLLLGKVFFRFFLHWSYNVRDIFYHLVVMRIFRESLHLEANASLDDIAYNEKTNESIRKRFEELNTILDNAYSTREEEKKNEIVNKYQKNLYKVLRNKMMAKRKSSSFSAQPSKEQKSGEFEFYSLPPGSPENSMDSKANFSQKYSIGTLSKQDRGRSQSETASSIVKVVYKVRKKDHDEVIRVNQDQCNNFRHEIYDVTEGKKSLAAKSATEVKNLYEASDFEVGSIEESQLGYIETGIAHFKKIKDILKEHSKDTQWEVPVIKMEITLDSKQIQPESIDDW